MRLTLDNIDREFDSEGNQRDIVSGNNRVRRRHDGAGAGAGPDGVGAGAGARNRLGVVDDVTGGRHPANDNGMRDHDGTGYGGESDSDVEMEDDNIPSSAPRSSSSESLTSPPSSSRRLG